MLTLDQQNQWREEYRQINLGWQPETETYADLVRQHLRPNSQILDLGCGRGGLIEQLVETHGRDLLERSIGLDPDHQSIHEHRLDLAAAVGFSHALPYASNRFDVVFCSWLLEHLETPEKDLVEIGRVLKPGGVFIFITPNKKHPISWLNQTIGRFGAIQDWLVERLYGRKAADTFPTWYKANSTRQIETLASTANLAIDQLLYIPDPTYLAINRPMFRLMCWFENMLPHTRKLHLVGQLRSQSLL